MVHHENISNIRSAIDEYRQWPARIRAAIMTRQCDLSVAEAGGHDESRFGQWLTSFGQEGQAEDSVAFHVISRLHREFHQTAAQILELSLSRQKDAAFDLLDGEFAALSDRFARGLAKWEAQLEKKLAA